MSQFVHGLCLPFHLMRVLLADGAVRWRYLKVSTAQAVVILALAVVFTGSGKEAVETVGPEAWSEQEEVQEDEEEARSDEEARREAERERKVEAAVRMAAALANAEEREDVRAALEKARSATGKAQQLREAQKELKSRKKRTVHRVVYWATLFSALQVAQWVVIALSRDYHTELARELSLRTGLVPEDEPLTPRVRLNTEWLRKKAKRRVLAAVVFSLGVPLLWVLKAVPGGSVFFPVLLSAWGAWWFVVYTAGKSARAWHDKEPREPWFLRAWKWLPTRFPLFRWALFGMYGSVWTTFTRPVFSPAATVERHPWTFSGLAVTRALSALPLVKCFLRPLVSVAATHLMVQAAPEGEGSANPRPGDASAPAPEVAPPASGAPPPRPPDGSPTTG